MRIENLTVFAAGSCTVRVRAARPLQVLKLFASNTMKLTIIYFFLQDVGLSLEASTKNPLLRSAGSHTGCGCTGAGHRFGGGAQDERVINRFLQISESH